MSNNQTFNVKQAFLELVSRQLEQNRKSYFIGFDVSRHYLNRLKIPQRVCDMPISEESILGIAVGMNRVGHEVFVDLMFEAFTYKAMDILVNQLAISNLLYLRQKTPIIVRSICGPFIGGGPQHGSVGYALLTRIPNILVASPVLGTDITSAYAIAKEKNKLLFFLFGNELNPDINIKTKINNGLIFHSVGKGRQIVILCWGFHSSLVYKAVTEADNWDSVSLLIPLFISPLLINEISAQIKDADALLIIDGACPSATMGEWIASKVRKNNIHGKIYNYNMWDDEWHLRSKLTIRINLLAQFITQIQNSIGNVRHR